MEFCILQRKYELLIQRLLKEDRLDEDISKDVLDQDTKDDEPNEFMMELHVEPSFEAEKNKEEDKTKK